MQFTKKFKYIIFIKLFLLFSVCLNAQENDTLLPVNDSDTTEIKEVKKKNRFFNFFKKKDKTKVNSEEEDFFEDEELFPDTAEEGKSKKRFFDLFRKKNKKDSVVNDSLDSDSSENKKRFSLFKKNKTDSSDTEGISKPQRISLLTWNKLNYIEQDSILRAWDEYDKDYYKKKKRYSFTRKEVEIALKSKRNIYERFIYNKARNKPFKYRRKIISRTNSRYKKTLRYDRMNKTESGPGDTISDKKLYQVVNKRYKREAKKEAIRKNQVIIKFDRKEERLRRKNELSGDERMALNKGRGMRLKGSELALYNSGKRKQEAFTTKLLELRRRRSFELQSEEVQKRMKKKNAVLTKRDKEQYNHLINKKKKKSDKHDSHEYPKRYH